MIAVKQVEVNLGGGHAARISSRGIFQSDGIHSFQAVYDLDQAILIAKAVLAIAEPTAVAGDVLCEIERMVALQESESARIAEIEEEDARAEALEIAADRMGYDEDFDDDYEEYRRQVISDYYHDRL